MLLFLSTIVEPWIVAAVSGFIGTSRSFFWHSDNLTNASPSLEYSHSPIFIDPSTPMRSYSKISISCLTSSLASKLPF